MSIEKHLEQHAEDPGRLHDLTLESEERPKLKFDVARDITSEDWNAMLERLNAERKPDRWLSFARFAFKLHLLDPERDIGITEADQSVLRKHLSEYRGNGVGYIESFNTLAPRLRTLGIKKDLDITESEWDDMFEALNSKKTGSSWLGFTRFAFNMRLLDPSCDLGITERDWSAMLQRLSDAPSRSNTDFAELASLIRLLDPSHNPAIAESDWKNMLELLSALKSRERWWEFAVLASSLRILSAFDVRITGPGRIKITDRSPDFHTETLPRPVRKSV